jgi:carbonic anhydrase
MHTCDAAVITCIDFRFQDYINDWISKNIPPKSHDRVAWAGGVKDLDNVLNQIAISKRLHDIKKVVLINHEDCGAFGEAGTPKKHAVDLKNAAYKVREQTKNIEVQIFYLHLDGTFEEIK